MANDYSFKISGAAMEDIESINRYISVNLHNPSAAKDLNKSFREAIARTCATPHMWPRVNSKFVKDATLRKMLVKNYIVFYRSDDDKREILVVRVLYGMRNFIDIL